MFANISLQNKYVFPGADASTPLGFFVDSLEGAGFEVKAIDTIGVHYSATLWRWYRNWLANKEKVVAKYGDRWYRVRSCLVILQKVLWQWLIDLLHTDLGILPCLQHHYLAPGRRYLLPDYPGQEHQLHPPH